MFFKVNKLLSKRNKKTLLFLLVLSVILSVIEVVGIAAIMPFISVSADPSIVFDNKYYAMVFNFFNLTKVQYFVIYFGLFLILFYLFRAVYIVYYTYIVNKFSMEVYGSFSSKMFRNYLNMPYVKFVNENIGMLSKALTSESYQLAFVVQNILVLMSEVLIILLLYVMMLFVNIEMTLLLSLILGGMVIFLKHMISSKIVEIGDSREEIQGSLYKIINETFGNFKLIKFISNQKEISNNFFSISQNYGKIFIQNSTLQIIPRNFLESFGFSILIGVVIYIVAYKGDVTSLIPIVSMYALALYRILPATTKILNSYNNILFHSKSLDIVYRAMEERYCTEGSEVLLFKKYIVLEGISFRYKKNNNIFLDVSLKIRRGQKVAFIGESGRGKSTLVDIICGLYKPYEGRMLIDDVELNDYNIVSWRKKIGYIPQNIYLFDGTVSQNISFGREYDENKVIDVLKQANIYNVLQRKDGLETMVGEGGIQLSGGQKQRIGIARALYGNPEILVLDEATSALDTETEEKIMNEIYEVSRDKTLIVIAHRLSTIKKCDVKIDVSKLNVS